MKKGIFGLGNTLSDQSAMHFIQSRMGLKSTENLPINPRTSNRQVVIYGTFLDSLAAAGSLAMYGIPSSNITIIITDVDVSVGHDQVSGVVRSLINIYMI